MTEGAATAEHLFEGWFAGMSANEELMPGITVEAAQKLLTPAPAPSGSRWRPGVVYGTAGRGGRDLVLELYAGHPGERKPGVVFIHGGGWKWGHPWLLVGQAGEMAAKGYVTATISYRFSNEAPWPAALEDAKCAVRFMRAQADEIGLDPCRIAVAGGSSGGHLAAMVALTPGRFEGAGGWDEVSSEVQAAVLYNPALDLSESGRTDLTRPFIEEFLGGDGDAANDASPLTHVTPACPPVLTRVGALDQSTPAATCEAFHRLLDAACVPNRLEILAGKGHGIPLHDHAGCVRAMAPFLADHLLLAQRGVRSTIGEA